MIAAARSPDLESKLQAMAVEASSLAVLVKQLGLEPAGRLQTVGGDVDSRDMLTGLALAALGIYVTGNVSLTFLEGVRCKVAARARILSATNAIVTRLR